MEPHTFVYTVYKTTNLLNTRFYYGVHRTQNPQDNYLGSGVVIRRALMKYGREHFTKEVLFQFETLEEANVKEIELISSARIDPHCYNIHPGGCGDSREQISSALKGKKRRPLSIEHRAALSRIRMGKPKSPEHRKRLILNLEKARLVSLSPASRKKQAISKTGKPGHQHTEEFKQTQARRAAVRQRINGRFI